MNLPAWLRALAARFLHRAQLENDMQEELRSHIQLRADDLERSGLNRAEAERRARIEFGARERYREESREAFAGNFLESLLQDVRFSLRVLRKSPGFTIVAILTLALSIGANSVVFGLMNALILHPLNLPDVQNLYMIEWQKGNGNLSYPDYLDLRDRNRSFDGLAAYNVDLAGLDTGDNPTRVWVEGITGNYFGALHIQPYLGRLIRPSDERGPDSAPYIVLSYTYWHTHFQDDPGVVGRLVQLNKHPFTIIGVAPPGFHGTLVFAAPDLFFPFVNQEQVSGVNVLNERGKRAIFMSVGHLKPGVTPAQAAADLDSIGAYLEKTYPKDDGHVNFALSSPSLYGNRLGPPVRAFIGGLMLLAGLILLAACVNLGNLFAARAADRSRDVALRLALGAKRSRILRGLLTEALLIAVAGGAFGLWGSVALLRSLSAWQPVPRFPFILPVSPDANIYEITFLLALLSAIVFGLVPLRQTLRVDPHQIIKAGPGGAAGRRITTRDLLLVVQIAICAVLITSSMVAARGLLRSMHSSIGFDPQNATLMNTASTLAGYKAENWADMQTRMIRAMESIPGVDSVGLVNEPPLYGGAPSTQVFTSETADLRSANAAARPYTYDISPDYFRAAGTTLLAGRAFSWHDDLNNPRVAAVNREFARKLFGSPAKAVGRDFKLANGTRIQVVAIVEDGKYWNLAEDPQPAMFLPVLQSPAADTWLVVRSNVDPPQLAPAMKDKLRALDPGLPSYIATWNKELEFSLFPARMATLSLGVLGAMGAMLSVTGIFGMAAYSVSRRLKELGIRLALGAQRTEVLQAALGRTLKLLAYSSAAGLVLGILASRILAYIVLQATPRDPFVLAGVIVAMALLGLLATWIPAQRALSLDPLKLLREE